MATISNTPRPGYVWDATDNVWYPIGVGGHGHSDYITQATAVNPTIIDAKGDIITATAADTPARLAVGNNGETLVADSSTSSGLRWQAPAAENPILNSAFQVWQRGTTFSSSGQYGADRYYFNMSTNITISRQTTSDTTNLPFIQYCARLSRSAGATNVTYPNLIQSFETVNSIPYAGKTVTWSFYARKGANFSGPSSQIYAKLKTGTGTDQALLAGYTGEVVAIDQLPTLTTTWQRFSYTATLATNITELGFQVFYETAGTAGAADYFEVTGFQLEVGSVATPFKTYAGTLQGELAACQRYYTRFGGTIYNAIGTGVYVAATVCRIFIPMPVFMRTAPTLSNSTASDFGIFNGSGNDQASGLSANSLDINSAALDFTVTSRTAGYGGIVNTRTNSTAYIAFSSEL